MSVVNEYFDALKNGKIGELENLLTKASEIGLDVDTVDSNGYNAYVVAINEGFDIIIKVLLSFKVEVGDALLYAVDNNSVEAVNALCSYAGTLPERDRLKILDCRCSTDEFPKITTPIIQAALKNNFTIVKILFEHGVRVPDPEKDLERFTAPPGTLERSKEMLSIYRALASDAYISGCSVNPILKSFSLTDKLRNLSERLEEFKSEFSELAHQVQEYAGKLLEKTRDTEEILTVLTFTEGQTAEPSISSLSLVEYAIACSQKDFIAHPNCQKAVINQFFRHLILLREKSTLQQIMVHLLIMFAFPFLSIAFLVFPTKRTIRILQVPDMDDVAINNRIQKRSLEEAALQDSEFLTHSIPSLKNHILLSLNDTENNVNSNLEDNLDTFLVDLMQGLQCMTPDQETSGTCTEPKPDRLHFDSNNPTLVMESMYALAVVLAVLRMSSIAVIVDFIGPLQISLSGMVIDILSFGVIFSVVWLAFSIGMNQVQHPFQAIDYDNCIRSMADNCQHGAFSSIAKSLETFYWTLLGNVGFTTSYVGNGRFVFNEWISILFFAFYLIVGVIILLNALIAMMSNTYCAVEENADTEWKFSRTATWMSFMNQSISLPPPFNIVPSPWKYCQKLKTHKQGDSSEQDMMRELNSRNAEYFKRKFQNVIDQLVDRFVHETTADENSVEGGISKKDIQSLKNEVVSFRYECGNMLKILSREMDETVKQTGLTKDKLKITQDISTNATVIYKKLSEQKTSFSDIHTDLRNLNDQRPKQSPQPAPKPEVKSKGTKVSNMANYFEHADEVGLSEDAKTVFQ
ncbi:short transient receptor potential channel 5-like [Anneissia japonica]|uniref:short transient receptor potential channel 5-like n=1 Tax=Anneissia japonica TaxID=1529436 RepID=UPI00142551A3|nr:short transient receptor potential channel 5-like [Anneissia japonica]